MTALQRRRLYFRAGFFVLFVLAPPLDIFRLDLTLGHFIIFGHDWTLGLDAFRRGEIGPGAAALNLALRAFLPVAALVGALAWVSWHYGRLYCGWLCPHFSVVETINGLMRRAFAKPTLWERTPLPERLPDGRVLRADARYWLPTLIAVIGFAFLWALTLLTYLLPPAEIYSNILHATLTRNQGIFLTAATLAFTVEFLLARHLFCRYGCAIGLFQSFVWMANKKAMVVGFDRKRASACADCNAACDHACPMRLKPRTIKRHMFACAECGQCLSACGEVQRDNPDGPLLQWVQGQCSLDVSDRDFGRHPQTPADCYRQAFPVRVVMEAER